MKKLALCILTLGIASSAFGGACTSTSLASYISQGSCTLGGYTFNNFSYLAVNILSPNVSAADINVTASVGANGPDVMFSPDSLLQASGVASVAEYIFGFEVTSNAPNIGFQSVMLTETGATSGVLSTAAVAEVDCYGGLLQLPNQVNHLVGVACLGGGVAAGASVQLDNAHVGPVNANIVFNGFSTTVDVLKDVTLSSVLGSASVTGIDQSFTTQMGTTATPEPASFFMGGCGLIGLAMIGRHRLKGAARK